MKSQILKKIILYLVVVSGCACLMSFTLFLFFSIHSLEAPYILLTNPEKLGKKLGLITIRWNGKEKSCWVYSSKQLRNCKVISCLLIYPKFRLNPFPYGHALKITEESIAIFNDSPTECLPMGKWLYESNMAHPVYSVNDDLKGWDAKYEIIKDKIGIKYIIYPSKYSQRHIFFHIPFFYFDKLKEISNKRSK